MLFNIKVIDVRKLAGLSIDRELNKELGMKFFKTAHNERTGYKIDMYVPQQGKNIQSIGIIVQLALQIETNLKLNLINFNGESMYTNEQKNDTEFHHVVVELAQTNLSLNFFVMIKSILRKLFGLENKQQQPINTNWIFADFDYCLDGNPLCDYNTSEKNPDQK